MYIVSKFGTRAKTAPKQHIIASIENDIIQIAATSSILGLDTLILFEFAAIHDLNSFSKNLYSDRTFLTQCNKKEICANNKNNKNSKFDGCLLLKQNLHINCSKTGHWHKNCCCCKTTNR